MTAIILSVAQITSSPLYGKDNSEKKDYVVVTKENSLSAIKKISAAYRAGTKKLEGRILKARLTEFQAFELRKNRNIIAVEPDIMLKGSMESAENAPIEDKGKDAFWNSKMINAYCKDGKPSKRIRVALLDSGIDYFMQDDLHVKARKDFRIANITYYYYIQVKELNSTRDEAVKKHYEQINITVNKGKVVRE